MHKYQKKTKKTIIMITVVSEFLFILLSYGDPMLKTKNNMALENYVYHLIVWTK